MKKNALFLSALFALLFSVSAFAMPGGGEESPDENLRAAIIKRMERIDLIDLGVKAEDVRIQFTINKNGEIVVLDVDSDNELLARAIKARLNYKSAGIEGLTPNTPYFITVRFQVI